MFDFQKLIVYQKAKSFNSTFYAFIKSNKELPSVYKDQLRRASFSVMLNIAEGTSRFSQADKRNFYAISRGSVFECVAILEFLLEEQIVGKEFHDQQMNAADELSRMLLALIRTLQK